ncbi:Golgin subfamily A member 7/ERF4 family-domain-containing protein [Trametes maxima]|nr:Golgin subfamily A member 7/ERF4 family-domain-containing protein [Trametes maxima]
MTSRPTSPSGAPASSHAHAHAHAHGPAHGLAEPHAHAPSTSASPIPPTPPPKDPRQLNLNPHHNNDYTHPAADAHTMARGTNPLDAETDPADSVIDISGPGGAYDPDETLRASLDAHTKVDGEDEDEDGDGDTETELDGVGAEAGAEGEVEADVTTAHGSAVYGSGAETQTQRERERGRERERERDRDGERTHVQEHPLRLDVHPPSPPPPPEAEPWALQDEAERGRASPQRFEFSTAKTRTLREFGAGKPRSHHRPQKPRSAYYFGPPPPDSAYGTDPMGQIGVHHPREVVRIERDYTGGELPQFASTYPLELEGRITPTQFLETINTMNEILISAHSLGHSFVDNALAFFTLQASRAVTKSHYEKEMDRLKRLIDELNEQIYNPVGLHIKWPKNVAFLFAEIEYY